MLKQKHALWIQREGSFRRTFSTETLSTAHYVEGLLANSEFRASDIHERLFFVTEQKSEAIKPLIVLSL